MKRKLAIEPKTFAEKWYLALVNGERSHAMLWIPLVSAPIFVLLHFRHALATDIGIGFYLFMAIVCLLLVPLHFERHAAYVLLKRLTEEEDCVSNRRLE